MSNWRGFVVSTTNSENVAFWFPGYALIAAATIVAAFGVWRSKRERNQSYAVAVLLPLFLSPHMHTQTLVLLLLVGAIILRANFQDHASEERQALAASVILTAYSLAFFLPMLAILGLSLGIFPLLGLYALTIARWPAPPAALSVKQTPPHATARAA
jgi:hypothetical protein